MSNVSHSRSQSQKLNRISHKWRNGGEKEPIIVEINKQKTKHLTKDQSIEAKSCLFGKTNKIKKNVWKERR